MTPAYHRIEQYLLEVIRGLGDSDGPLPTEQTLAQRFGVSRMTARRGFERLVSKGVVVRYPGRGTYLRRDVRATVRIDPATSYPDSWAFDGQEVTARVVQLCLAEPPDTVGGHICLNDDGLATYLERVRYVNGRVASWDRRWMPAGVMRFLDVRSLSHRSLLALLPGAGLQVARGTFEIRATVADESMASVLEVREGSPVLWRDLRFFDRSGNCAVMGATIYGCETVQLRLDVSV